MDYVQKAIALAKTKALSGKLEVMGTVTVVVIH